MLRKLLFVFSIVFGTATVAFSEPIKTCTTTLPDLSMTKGSQKAEISVYKLGDGYRSITEVGSQVLNDRVTIAEYKIRNDLAQIDPDQVDDYGLNFGESLVLHAMAVESDELLAPIMNSGINLKEVTHVKTYVIGTPSRFGSTTLVEAKNSSGKTLGTYLGGLLVSPCK